MVWRAGRGLSIWRGRKIFWSFLGGSGDDDDDAVVSVVFVVVVKAQRQRIVMVMF